MPVPPLLTAQWLQARLIDEQRNRRIQQQQQQEQPILQQHHQPPLQQESFEEPLLPQRSSSIRLKKMSGYKVDAKVVLLGKEYSGKTSFIERYIHNRFAEDQPYQSTIGAAYGAKRTEALGRMVTLGIWDTAGSERYQAMSRIYYRDTWAAILCYDLTNTVSWEKVRFWVAELHEHEPNARLYFVGTKVDQCNERPEMRQVETSTVRQYAGEQWPVFETSAKTGENVNEVFSLVAHDFVRAQTSGSGAIRSGAQQTQKTGLIDLTQSNSFGPSKHGG